MTGLKDEQRIREAICEIGAKLYDRGFVAGNEGNVSYRMNEIEILCTPTLMSKGELQLDDLCVVDREGTLLRGDRKPTSEILLHLEIYNADPMVFAVVHAHPPYVSAFAITGQDIPSGILPEAEIMLGLVPTVPYETPGSKQFAESIKPFVLGSHAAVLANHGCVTWGSSLNDAWWNTELLEQYCKILILAKSLGPLQQLTHEQISSLRELRHKFGR